MADEEDDPFEGLVLDEAFIRGASTFEPAARAREAAPLPVLEPEPAVERRLAWLVGAVLLALVGGLVFLVLSQQQRASRTTAGPASSTPRATPSLLGIEDKTYVRGRCYAWDQGLPALVPQDVDCADLHLFEAVQRTEITGYSEGAAYPTDEEWGSLDDRVCDPLVASYLDHALDPRGRYEGTSIRIPADQWEQGERFLQCGITRQSAPVAGVASSDVLPVSRGRADPSKQALTYPRGSCLVLGTVQTGSLSCGRPHTLEVAGEVALIGPSKAPSDNALAKLAAAPCQALVAGYLGRQPANGESVSFTPLAARSWEAGTHTVNCLLVLPSARTQGHQRISG